MMKLTASEARIPTKAFNEVAYNGERIRIEHRNGVAVVLISEKDLAMLEAIEDKIDIREARKILKRLKEGKEKAIPLEIVKKELGL